MPTATGVPLLRRPIFAAVAALVVAWLGFAALGKPDAPPEPPPLNRNVVASFWSVPITGGRPHLLFRTRGWQDSFPTYRKDGSLLFVRPGALGSQALVAATPSGAVRRLRALPVFTEPAYSAATDEIAVPRRLTIVAQSLSSGRTRVLAHVPAEQCCPVWSSDGSTLVWTTKTRTAQVRYQPELVVIRGGKRRTFSLPAGLPMPRALSPRGDLLLFAWGRQLFVLDTHTGRRHVFASDDVPSAAWSPDGRTVAYFDADGLVARDVRTNRRHVVVAGARAGWGTFSPDGLSFVYVTHRPK